LNWLWIWLVLGLVDVSSLAGTTRPSPAHLPWSSALHGPTSEVSLIQNEIFIYFYFAISLCFNQTLKRWSNKLKWQQNKCSEIWNSFVYLTLGRCLLRGRRTFGCQVVKAPRCRCYWTQNKNRSLPQEVRRPSSQEEPTVTRWTKEWFKDIFNNQNFTLHLGKKNTIKIHSYLMYLRSRVSETSNLDYPKSIFETTVELEYFY
jgi:hypothetical protein